MSQYISHRFTMRRVGTREIVAQDAVSAAWRAAHPKAKRVPPRPWPEQDVFLPEADLEIYGLDPRHASRLTILATDDNIVTRLGVLLLAEPWLLEGP